MFLVKLIDRLIFQSSQPAERRARHIHSEQTPHTSANQNPCFTSSARSGARAEEDGPYYTPTRP